MVNGYMAQIFAKKYQLISKLISDIVHIKSLTRIAYTLIENDATESVFDISSLIGK